MPHYRVNVLTGSGTVAERPPLKGVVEAAAGSDVPAGALHQAWKAARDRPPLISAAGGVNKDNAADYAAAGADLLVTSAPYSANPADVKVILTRLPAAEEGGSVPFTRL